MNYNVTAMCGRYSLAGDIEGLAYRFDFRATDLTYRLRFNVASTQQVLTVTNDGSANQAQLMKCGPMLIGLRFGSDHWHLTC